MNPRYPEVAARAGHRCEYCRAPEAVFNLSFEVEHVVPASRGGPTAVDNLALACRSCNLRKADHVAALDAVSGESVPLFNPRLDDWGNHFRPNPEAGSIEGLTPTGRATIDRLAVNSEPQVAARRQWIRLGLFP